MPFGIKFDGSVFACEYVGRKATRGIRAYLDGLGKDNLVYAIQVNKDLAKFYTLEQLQQVRIQVKVATPYVDSFSDEDVYGWIPKDYLELFKSVPGGEEWVRAQIKQIRQFILSS